MKNGGLRELVRKKPGRLAILALLIVLSISGLGLAARNFQPTAGEALARGFEQTFFEAREKLVVSVPDPVPTDTAGDEKVLSQQDEAETEPVSEVTPATPGEDIVPQTSSAATSTPEPAAEESPPEPQPADPAPTYPEPVCGVLLNITPLDRGYPWTFEGALNPFETQEEALTYRFLVNDRIKQESSSPYFYFDESDPGVYVIDLFIETLGGWTPKSPHCTVGPIELPLPEEDNQH